MEKIIRVGKMPGKITEVVVQVGTKVSEVLELAELNSNGFDIKVNGQLSDLNATITDDTELIILSQQVKGN